MACVCPCAARRVQNLVTTGIVSFVVLSLFVVLFALWAVSARDPPEVMAAWREALFKQFGTLTPQRELAVGE